MLLWTSPQEPDCRPPSFWAVGHALRYRVNPRTKRPTILSITKTCDNKVIRKVRKRQHRNPLFGHIGYEISKNRNFLAKNGDEKFWKQKFHAANRKAQHALTKGPIFSFFEGAGGEGFFPCSQCVLNVFSSKFQFVLKFSKCSQMHSSKCSQ